MNSALYLGLVTHMRFRPRRHHLRYRVFSLFLDLDELEMLDETARLFSVNRRNIFSFFERDHGDGNGNLRSYVETRLAAAGLPAASGGVRLLCSPRVFGYVFNPLCVYFCLDARGHEFAILYEVSNTFGQRHSYLIPVAPGEAAIIRQRCDKKFYVSPFMAMDMTYHFRLRRPDRSMAVVIDEYDDQGLLLNATLTGKRRPFGDLSLLRAFLRFPFLTQKITLGIHWEALKLWLKGVPLVVRPDPPPVSVTSVPHPLNTATRTGQL